jgi:hypothetical protein
MTRTLVWPGRMIYESGAAVRVVRAVRNMLIDPGGGGLDGPRRN